MKSFKYESNLFENCKNTIEHETQKVQQQQ